MLPVLWLSLVLLIMWDITQKDAQISENHHRLRSSTSPVSAATAHVNRQWWPTTPLNQSPKYLSQEIMLATPTPVLNLLQIRPQKGRKYNEYIFLFIDFWETPLQLRTLDGFLHLMAQMTQNHARMCLYGVSLTCSSFQGQIPIKPYFGGVHRHLQAKLCGESLTYKQPLITIVVQ